MLVPKFSKSMWPTFILHINTASLYEMMVYE